MLVSFLDIDLTQKQLYFKLNNALLLDHNPDKTKLPGVYAIFSKDICLYVGQSKNIASRLATHLKGKYGTDELSILIYLPYEYHEDFTEYSTKDQLTVLLKNESYLIKKLKPVENIIADYSKEINEEYVFTNIIEYPAWPDIEISIKRGSYLLSDTQPEINEIMNSNHGIINDWVQEYEEVKRHFEKRVANENH